MGDREGKLMEEKTKGSFTLYLYKLIQQVFFMLR